MGTRSPGFGPLLHLAGCWQPFNRRLFLGKFPSPSEARAAMVPMQLSLENIPETNLGGQMKRCPLSS